MPAPTPLNFFTACSRRKVAAAERGSSRLLHYWAKSRRRGALTGEFRADATVLWIPSIAVSSIAFYTGDKLPKWKGDVFVGGMRYGEIPGTGQLHRILINKNLEELRREPLLTDLRRRIRDVKQGPDGLLYLLTDEADAAMLRIEPAD